MDAVGGLGERSGGSQADEVEKPKARSDVDHHTCHYTRFRKKRSDAMQRWVDPRKAGASCELQNSRSSIRTTSGELGTIEVKKND